MYDSVLLDVVICLVFIFVILSLLCSGIYDFIAKVLGLRARMLYKAIQMMVDGKIEENAIAKKVYEHKLINQLVQSDWSRKVWKKYPGEFLTMNLHNA